MSVAILSKLDAVNAMLGNIGASPINSLSGTTTADVSAAVNMLDRTVAGVLSLGWHSNTEEEYPLAKDTSGYIDIPNTIASVDLDDTLLGYGSSYDIVLRHRIGSSTDLSLYDKKNHTFVFTENLKATVILLFEFEELPQAFRQYIAVSAARKYHDDLLGDGEGHRFDEQDELTAWTALKRFDNKTSGRKLKTALATARQEYSR